MSLQKIFQAKQKRSNSCSNRKQSIRILRKNTEAAEITKSIQEESTTTRKLELELQKLKSNEARSSEYQLKKKKRKLSPCAHKEKSSSMSAEDDTDINISSDDEFVPKLIREDSVPEKVLEKTFDCTGSHFNSNISLDSVSEQDIANQKSADVVESSELQVDPPTSSSVPVLATEDSSNQRPFLV